MKSIAPLPTSSKTVLSSPPKMQLNRLLLPITKTTTKTSTTASHRDVERNRTNMTILHFLLTYPKWSISLFLFLASRSLPLPSVDDAIHQPLRQLHSLLQAETNAYQQCVHRSFQRCSIAMNEAVQHEDDRVAQARLVNAQRLNQVNDLNAICLNVTQTTRNALQAWSQANTKTIPLVPNTAVCSLGDQRNLTILLHDGVAAVENELSDMNDYVSNSESFSHRLVTYVHDLAQYNYQYFVADKMQPVMKLLNEMSDPSFHPMSAIHLDVTGLNLDSRISLSLQGVQQVLQDAVNEMSIMMERLQEFDNSITNFHLQYLSLYNNFVKVVSFVQDLSLGLPLPSYFDIGSIPLADSLLPSEFGIPQFQGGMLDWNVVSLLMSNATKQVVEQLDRVLLQMAEGATTQVGLAEQVLAHQLRDMLTLQDYHPPVFTGMESEMTKLHDESQQAMTSVKNGLNQLWTTTTSNDVTDLLPPPSELDPNNVTFSANATNFDYLEPEFPSWSIPKMLEIIFGWFLHYMWLTELVLQGLRLWRLDTKYSRNATPDLPEIDYAANDDDGVNSRDDDTYLQRKLRSLQLLSFTMLKYMCCNVWIIVAIFAIPLCLGLSCWMYPHYHANCVSSRNGTFVARHVWAPLVVNQANVGGNTITLLSEAQLINEKSNICNRNVTDTTKFHRNELTLMSQTFHQYNQTLFLMSLMDRCVELDQLDGTLETACCGLKGYNSHASCGSMDGRASNWTCPIDVTVNPPAAFLPVRYYLSNPLCQPSSSAHDTSSWELEDSRFNCQALPKTCDVPCHSVDEDWILHQVIETECSMEGYYFGCIFLCVVALYHAVMLNLWTTLLFNGVKCLWWRNLNPHGLVLKTRIYEDGTLIQGAVLRQDRSERIRQVLTRFRWLGYLQLSLGMIILLGWMLSFTFLSTLIAV